MTTLGPRRPGYPPSDCQPESTPRPSITCKLRRQCTHERWKIPCEECRQRPRLPTRPLPQPPTTAQLQDAEMHYERVRVQVKKANDGKTTRRCVSFLKEYGKVYIHFQNQRRIINVTRSECDMLKKEIDKLKVGNEMEMIDAEGKQKQLEAKKKRIRHAQAAWIKLAQHLVDMSEQHKERFSGN